MIISKGLHGKICYDKGNMVERENLRPENFPSASQVYLVQGIVVDVSNTGARYIVTHVHDGRDEALDDHFYGYFTTATRRSPWFSEIPENYRSLWEEANDAYEYDANMWNDRVELTPDVEALTPGDTIHVHETIYWEHDEEGAKSGYHRVDVCKLPDTNMGVQPALDKIAEDRAHKVHLALAQLASSEQAEMQALDRLVPNQPIRPFESNTNETGSRTVRSQFVYGEGPVEDHFVKISASPAIDMDLEYGGVRRFGVDGSQFIVPSIKPFGSGTEEDPLYELKIHVTSHTKLNPAVGEVRPIVVIDGIKYQALVDGEQSSSSFKNPGHDVVFEGFRPEGVEFDMVKLTDEQIATMDARFKRRRDIAIGKVYGSIDRGEDFTGNLEAINEETRQEVQTQNELHEAERAIVESIGQNPRTYAISTGAAILVPRSMLDAVEVSVLSIGEE